MTDQPDKPAAAWAVISPDGTLTWYPLTATAEVEKIVSGDYAPGALARAFVSGALRVMASDIALLTPEHYPPNPLARHVITTLSGGAIIQPWRGCVALVEYERDDRTGEWLWPGNMCSYWAAAITRAVAAATPAADFDCEAYGPEGREHGLLCFFAGEPPQAARVCGSRDECARRMAAERRRVFARIQEMAAAGDETAIYLAEEFTHPEQLLGGGEDQ